MNNSSKLLDKQSLMRKILSRVGADATDPKYFSSGSTLTIEGFKVITEYLIERNVIKKQDLAFILVDSLGFKYNTDFNSSGGTVTKECLEAIELGLSSLED